VSYRDILRGCFDFDDNTGLYGKPFVNVLAAKSNLRRFRTRHKDRSPLAIICGILATCPDEAMWTDRKPWQ
jgi:hypothetical protein